MDTIEQKEKIEKKIAKGYSPREMEIRVIKNFLDVLILVEMKKQRHLSGYDVTAFLSNKFGGVLSPGTIYATLYSLERKGLILGESDGRKTIYKLTGVGEEIITPMMRDLKFLMTDFVKKFFIL